MKHRQVCKLKKEHTKKNLQEYSLMLEKEIKKLKYDLNNAQKIIKIQDKKIARGRL